ncbi:hypothetical protein TPHA_0F00760 [Tetrapisispora phaffii CBS 4417]|uniref:Uncharacterized protein n=1 Tax=Tetrapisispora phaffii (strain ATCC 24235 / CBS 4417 / NBRC 1672 / NRRL Y-8282 / UCD 70-5) TaxID=1071381 RepID=G8BUY0_TETPH|nr:hypothetical protein TPHA_0F00760 [Tetrapisispora phaffii CBS 4417]CCE63562.1 hypothetical protein TPHA_0F00760 [Tetrapisispora phaffii CBS 4417]
MNLLFQDPFSVLKEYPEQLTHTIENPLHTVCIKFSQYGDYLAVGSSNGSVIIFDMDTHKPITMLGNQLGSHTRSIQSIEWWSMDNRFILTSSRDWTIKLWDLSDSKKVMKTIQFEEPVWNCKWIDMPATEGNDDFKRNLKYCIVTTYDSKNSYLVNLSESDMGNESPVKSTLGENTFEIVDENESNEIDEGNTLTTCIYPIHKNLIIIGTSKGWLKFYRLKFQDATLKIKLLYKSKISNAIIKHLVVSENGDKLAINSSDRTIRQYFLNVNDENMQKDDDNASNGIELTLVHKYQDVINRLQWNSIFFSNNSAEYLIASTHGSSAHELYIWEANSGSLVRVLEGSQEELMDIDWNFYKMCIASNGLESGDIYLWSIVIPPKWSSLAPDFEEIEDNIDYQEKEDEFDRVDEIEFQQEQNEVEEMEIDLITREQYDIRGNDLFKPSFTIPPDYLRSILAQSHNKVFLP